MRLTKRRRNTRPDMNMTPMIDIVFLLLIFFMTVTQVSKINKERLELPKLQGSEDQQPTVLTINVTKDGEMRVSGTTKSLTQVTSVVNQELTRLPDPNLLTIVVRSDERGASRATNEVVRALAAMGIVRIRIAVEKPE